MLLPKYRKGWCILCLVLIETSHRVYRTRGLFSLAFKNSFHKSPWAYLKRCRTKTFVDLLSRQLLIKVCFWWLRFCLVQFVMWLSNFFQCISCKFQWANQFLINDNSSWFPMKFLPTDLKLIHTFLNNCISIPWLIKPRFFPFRVKKK